MVQEKPKKIYIYIYLLNFNKCYDKLYTRLLSFIIKFGCSTVIIGNNTKNSKAMLLWEQPSKIVLEKILEIMFICYFNFIDKLVTWFHVVHWLTGLLKTLGTQIGYSIRVLWTIFCLLKKLFFSEVFIHLLFFLQKLIIKRANSQTNQKIG